MSSSFKNQGCRFAVIFWTYILHLITQPIGILAVKVSITKNITGFVGEKDILLTCSFTLEKDQSLISVAIISKTETNNFNDTKPIATFRPQRAAKLHTSGDTRFGRVTLTNITDMSTNATIKFDDLQCTDEKEYFCKLNYFDKNEIVNNENSEPTRILVRASSSRPYSISTFIVSSTKVENQRTNSANFLRNFYNYSLSTKQNTVFALRQPTVYTMKTIQQQSSENSTVFLREGDDVIFTCTGNIGRPPGKLIWQKTYPLQQKIITYRTETTVKEEITEICSFIGTTNLTVQISAEDLKAKIRCFEESQADVPGMYTESGPFDVHFPVNIVNINKRPNKNQHERKTENITLTCKGNGNPEPKYIWFKKDNKGEILSRTNLYIIEDVMRNDSGVYICEAYNKIDNREYRKYNSVEIYIVDDLLSSSDSASSMISAVHAAYVVPLISAAVFIVTYITIRRRRCIRQKQIIKYTPVAISNNTVTIGESKNSLDVINEKQEDRFRSSNKKNEDPFNDVITVDPEYATVVIINHADTSTKSDDTSDISNGIGKTKKRSRIKYMEENQDTRDPIDISENMTIYAVPSDTLETEHVICKIVTDVTSVIDREKYGGLEASDQTAMHGDLTDQTNDEMSKTQTSVPLDNVDHDGVNVSADQCHI